MKFRGVGRFWVGVRGGGLRCQAQAHNAQCACSQLAQPDYSYFDVSIVPATLLRRCFALLVLTIFLWTNRSIRLLSVINLQHMNTDGPF